MNLENQSSNGRNNHWSCTAIHFNPSYRNTTKFLRNSRTHIPVGCGGDSHVQALQFLPELAVLYYLYNIAEKINASNTLSNTHSMIG